MEASLTTLSYGAGLPGRNQRRPLAYCVCIGGFGFPGTTRSQPFGHVVTAG